MSSAARFAVVAEGPTDLIVIEAAIKAIYGPATFSVTLLQPQGSVVFGSNGGGWPGVYKWCAQFPIAAIGPLLQNRFDALVIHLDGDVAGSTYQSANVEPRSSDLPLPCHKMCPPAIDTCSSLESVLGSWLGVDIAADGWPPAVVACIPSKSTEAWVVRCLYPTDSFCASANPECQANPEARLSVKGRVKKRTADYREISEKLEQGWPLLVADPKFVQSQLFQARLTTVVPIPP